MNTRAAIATSFAALAVVLIGVTIVQTRERIAALKSDITFLENQVASVNASNSAFSTIVYGADFLEKVAQIADEQDAILRRQMAAGLISSFDGLVAPLPLGFDIFDRVTVIAATAEADLRAIQFDSLQAYLFGEPNNLSESISEIPPQTATTISTLVTAAGAAGSSLASLVAFLLQGGTRRLDEEMLELDVELKRIEVAKARYAAREALGAQPPV